MDNLLAREESDLFGSWGSVAAQASSQLVNKIERIAEHQLTAEMFASMVHQRVAFTYRPVSYLPRLGEAKLGSTADGWNILRKLITRRFVTKPLM